MEILEVLLALALWLIFAFLGWRKRAARSGPTPAAPGPPVVDEQPASEPAPEEGEPRGLAAELRELVRQIREGLEPAEPPPTPAAPADEAEPVVAVAPPEPPPPPTAPSEPFPRSPVPALLPPSARPSRSPLVGDLLRDLRSGPRSLARAVLLGEVLGPPVALRGEERRDVPAGGG